MIKKWQEFNELNKSTYKSAAEKLFDLGGVHKERGEKILAHSRRAGLTDDIHNIHYHGFTISGEEKYMISRSWIKEASDRGRFFINNILLSETGHKIGIDLDFQIRDGEMCYEKMWIINFSKTNGTPTSSTLFKFNNRIDAREFKEFIINEHKNKEEAKELIECFKKVSINKLYA